MIINPKDTGFGIWPIIIILLLAIVLIGGYFSFNKNNKVAITPEIKALSLLPKPKVLDNKLAFTDHNNQPFSIAALQGKWSILFFGYTSCPDVCPMQMSLLKQFVSSAEITEKPQAILVSIDPKRDTAERLKAYVQGFNPEFMGISAKKPELERFARELGVYYEYAETAKGVDQDHSQHQHHDHKQHTAKENKPYELNHTASFILINPKGEYAGLFTAPYNIKKMVKAYNKVAK
jgi:protein SCO1/2